ncbi:unnamed protein product [Ostreobium quekettii]|uniref:Plastid lipid-associated protein/fibrillin conserved domain-containing protein n=2 Tax=Ostreobium quekettii TaxID=121088 RepID=A0A8S1IUL1_9CHLO|nr:unnamed protein product [Ostreobium quekettii]
MWVTERLHWRIGIATDCDVMFKTGLTIERMMSPEWEHEGHCTAAVVQVEEAQNQILDVVKGVGGRGQAGLDDLQLQRFEEAVQVLEASRGIEAPTADSSLIGRWRLLFTTTPGTESPVQRTFTGVDAFQVFQDIVQGDDGIGVRNVVKFGEKIGALRVEAASSTDSQPIPGFVPRQGEGIPLLGKSITDKPAERKDMRIDFQFDRAGFKFRWPVSLSIPYPVPFRILGDERKGWLDVTYLSPDGTLRLCRGNKGTLFVLTKVDRSAKEALLDAINEGARDDEVLKLINELAKENPTPAAARSPLAEGKWITIFNKQEEDANPLARLSGVLSQYQEVGAAAGPGGLDNVVIFVPLLLSLRAKGRCRVAGDERCVVNIDSIVVEIPGKEFNVDIPNDGSGFVDYLYLDEDLRIVKGNRGGYYVGVKEAPRKGFLPW